MAEIMCSFPGCTLVFVSEYARNYHVRKSHANDKPLSQCPHCPQFFVNAARMRQHVKEMHEGERVMCTWPGCVKSYTRKGTMLQHFNTHTGTKPCVCTVCQKRFYYPIEVVRCEESHNVPSSSKAAAE